MRTNDERWQLDFGSNMIIVFQWSCVLSSIQMIYFYRAIMPYLTTQGINVYSSRLWHSVLYTPNYFSSMIKNIISLCDNKSVSHWIMFSYCFHVWKVNIFFSLQLCSSSILAHMCKVPWKKIDNKNTLTHICCVRFSQMASYYVT